MSRLDTILRREEWRQRRPLRQAAILAAGVGICSVALLGLSGWFITAAAAAGAAGLSVAMAFNYMLPSAVVRLLAVVRTGARYGEAVAGHAAGLRIGARLRPALFGAIAQAPVERALALRAGSATARLIDDVATLETALVRRSTTWSAAAAMVVGIAATGVVDLTAMASLLVWAALLCVATRTIARHGRWPVARRDGALAAMRAEVADVLRAAPELRCYAADRPAMLVTGASRALATAQARVDTVQALHAGAQAIAMTGAAATVLVLSREAAPAMVALATLAAAMTIDGLTPWLRRVAEADAVQRARAGLAETLAAERPDDALPVRLGDAPELALFGRPIPAGMRVQVTGASGSGKTTVLEELLALRPRRAGRARLGGVDTAYLPADVLRRQFGWLPQDGAALAGTVRDNLVLARPAACEAALWHALHDAGLDAVIRALPDGLDSWIGDDGARLSGGERRRLGLARALLADARWLLLDEPLEGLDEATAATVLARIDRRLRRTGQGLILTSHRPLPPGFVDRSVAVTAVPVLAVDPVD